MKLIIANTNNLVNFIYGLKFSLQHNIYIYSILTGFWSLMLIRTAKLVRCLVRQVITVLLDWFLSTVNPSVDQPPKSMLQ